MINQNLRTVALVVFTFVYLLIGAAVFEAIESANERAEKRRLQAEEDYYFRSLYNVSDDHFEKMAINIMRSAPYKDNEQWKFPGAFYFVTTVITTIGLLVFYSSLFLFNSLFYSYSFVDSVNIKIVYPFFSRLV